MPCPLPFSGSWFDQEIHWAIGGSDTQANAHAHTNWVGSGPYTGFVINSKPIAKRNPFERLVGAGMQFPSLENSIP